MSICLLRKSTSSRAERLLRNKACCVGLRTRRACLTSEGQRRLTPISDCARNWDLDKIYRIGKLTEFTSATTRHSAFSASAVFPRPEVAPSRDKKGLSRVRFAHSRAGSCFSALGEAPSSDRRGPSRPLGCQIGD